MVLHVLKHLKSDCYGVLIGKIRYDTKNDAYEIIEISDTFQFSHDKVFCPLLEIFLRMVDNKLKAEGKGN